MAKTITAAPCTLVITNTYDPTVKVAADLPEEILKPDDVFNTGMSALGDPHADEPQADKGKTIVKDAQAWEAEHIASIRLYRTNSYVYLAPEDSIELTTKTGEETAYYLSQKFSDFVTVTVQEESGEG